MSRHPRGTALAPVLLLLLSVVTAPWARAGCGFNGRCPTWDDRDRSDFSDAAVSLAGDGTVLVAGTQVSRPAVTATAVGTGRWLWTRALPVRETGSLDDVIATAQLAVVTGTLDYGTVSSSGYPITATVTAAMNSRTGRVEWVRQVPTSGGFDVGARVLLSPNHRIAYSVGVVGERSTNDQPTRWRVVAYDATNGRELWRWTEPGRGRHDAISGAALSTDGSTIVLGGPSGGSQDADWSVAGLDTRTHRLRWSDHRDNGNDEVEQVVASPDGRTVYAVGVNQRLTATSTFLTAQPTALQILRYAWSSGHVSQATRIENSGADLWPNAAASDADGGLCIAGESTSTTSGTTPYLTCLDPNGRQRFEEHQSEANPQNDGSYRTIAIDIRRHQLIVGGNYSNTVSQSSTAMLVVADLTDGRQRWRATTAGSSGVPTTTISHVCVTSGPIIAAGTWSPPTRTGERGAHDLLLVGFQP